MPASARELAFLPVSSQKSNIMSNLQKSPHCPQEKKKEKKSNAAKVTVEASTADSNLSIDGKPNTGNVHWKPKSK